MMLGIFLGVIVLILGLAAWGNLAIQTEFEKVKKVLNEKLDKEELEVLGYQKDNNALREDIAVLMRNIVHKDDEISDLTVALEAQINKSAISDALQALKKGQPKQVKSILTKELSA